MAYQSRMSNLFRWTITALIALAPLISTTSSFDFYGGGRSYVTDDGILHIVFATIERSDQVILPADARAPKQWINTPHDAHAGVYTIMNTPLSAWRTALARHDTIDPHIRA